MTTLKIMDGKVDITDPCYDRGTWCAEWEVGVENGEYEVTTDETDGRTSSISMMLKGGKPIQGKEIAIVGVDAGLCGFFVDKPNFDEDWHSICDMIEKQRHEGKDIYEIPSGVCSDSGWGDGSYPVIAAYDVDDKIVGLTIVFIEEQDDKEE